MLIRDLLIRNKLAQVVFIIAPLGLLLSAASLTQAAETIHVESAHVEGARAIDVQAAAPMRDPYVPASARPAKPAAPTSGVALRAQVLQKLQKQFDQADTTHAGYITREQAKATGWQLMADQFDQIDTQRSGTIKFSDIQRYLKTRGAKL